MICFHESFSAESLIQINYKIESHIITYTGFDFLHMMESLVDYVLERGHKDYGEFAPR